MRTALTASPRKDRRALLLAAAGGVCFALAAPPTNLYPAVLLGMAVLFLAGREAHGMKRAAFVGWVWAASAGVVGMRFVPVVIERFTPVGYAGGVLALLLLSAFQALSWAVGMALAFVLERRAGLDGRVAFGAGALAAIMIPTVFGWTPAGLISPWPVWVQLAELIGGRGVSFVLAVAAALLAAPLVRFLPWGRAGSYGRAWASAGIGAALIAFLGAYGAARMPQVRARMARQPKYTVGVVQGAVGARLRWNLSAEDEIVARLKRLTVEAEQRGAQLSIWPEAAYPFVLRYAESRTPRGSRGIIGGPVKGPVLVGLLTQPAHRFGEYNSAAIVDRHGVMELPQAKQALLWFGETIPFGQYMPWLRRIFFRSGGLIPGDAVDLQYSGPARIGVLICYEDTLAGIGRRIAKARPNLLVNITNDAWFGPTAEPELHLRLSALRAIETRLDLVRAVNLGIPAWIDATGTVRRRGSTDRQSVMLVSPTLNEMSPTLYTKAGDMPLLVFLFALTLVAVLRTLWAKRRSEITGPDP